MCRLHTIEQGSSSKRSPLTSNSIQQPLARFAAPSIQAHSKGGTTYAVNRTNLTSFTGCIMGCQHAGSFEILAHQHSIAVDPQHAVAIRRPFAGCANGNQLAMQMVHAAMFARN